MTNTASLAVYVVVAPAPRTIIVSLLKVTAIPAVRVPPEDAPVTNQTILCVVSTVPIATPVEILGVTRVSPASKLCAARFPI